MNSILEKYHFALFLFILDMRWNSSVRDPYELNLIENTDRIRWQIDNISDKNK